MHMKQYRMDRSAFSMRSHEETERHSFIYWKGQSVEERFKAAAYLNSVAYGYSLSSPPKMDKTVFSTRKR